MNTLAELTDEMVRLSRQLDKGIDFLRDETAVYAQAENDYRMAKAKAYLAAPDGTVDAKRAHTDLATGKERFEARLADGMRQAALEAVRSRRQQISALQTLVSAHKAEAEYDRTSPR